MPLKKMKQKKVLNLIVATRISSYENEMCMSNCTITLVYHAESVHGRAHLHVSARCMFTNRPSYTLKLH